MKRLTFFKVYGAEDPKLAGRRKWSAWAETPPFFVPGLRPYQRAILQQAGPLRLNWNRRSGRSTAMEVLAIQQQSERALRQRLVDYREAPPISDNRTANLARELTGKEIEQCRHCGETPRKGLMHGLCFRCSGEKAINREI